MSKYTYAIETYYQDKWIALIRDTRDFCLGYLAGCQYDSPRNAYRLIRSDGKVLNELAARDEVSIGMIASYPTPEQYEYAANKALEQAKRIREFQAKQERLTVNDN